MVCRPHHETVNRSISARMKKIGDYGNRDNSGCFFALHGRDVLLWDRLSLSARVLDRVASSVCVLCDTTRGFSLSARRNK